MSRRSGSSATSPSSSTRRRSPSLTSCSGISAQLDTLGLGAAELRRIYGPLRPALGLTPSPAAVRAQSERAQTIVREAAEARMLRAVLSRRQLQEVMVDFWFNHFNVFSGKGTGRSVDRQLRAAGDPSLRARAGFRDLLFATAKHPAMLVYLDNSMSSAPGSPGARGAKRGLNENFAREVMELHTLGADGGYTQEDVITLARILTGWGLNRPGCAGISGACRDLRGQPSRLQPQGVPRSHLSSRAARPRARRRSTSWRAAPRLRVISPSSSRSISSPTVRRPPLVERLAARFLETGGDIGGTAQDAIRQPRVLGQSGPKIQDALPIRDLGGARRRRCLS